ncbi:MAG: hypothetical protein IKD21_04280 [Clostridia bacterium]|nr:hypothetical protein [Clostridia bacterium]
MLLTIIKDSFIIFLLVYALLDIAEKLCLYLSRFTVSPTEHVRKYYVIDISNTQADQLEYALRKALTGCKDNILLITENNPPETDAIIANLRREFAGLYPVTRSEFQHITSTMDIDLNITSLTGTNQ